MDKYELLKNPIVWIALVVLLVIILAVNVIDVKSEDCTWFQGVCYYPYPMPELRREFLPVIANASLPTPAPTMNPFPTITYPPPVTPVP